MFLLIIGLHAGIDIPKGTHHVAVADERGRRVADQQFLVTASGYRHIVAFLCAQGRVHAVGVEDIGSYGADLVRGQASSGMPVMEVMRINRQHRRL